MASKRQLQLIAVARKRKADAEGAVTPMPTITPAQQAAPVQTAVRDPGLMVPGDPVDTTAVQYKEPSLLDHILGAGNYVANTTAQGIAGVGEGVTTLAGLPADLINISPELLNLVPGLHQEGTPGFGPMTEHPTGGSENLNWLLHAGGLIPTLQEGSDPFQRVVRRTGQEVGANLVPEAGVLTAAARMGVEGARAASPLAKMFGVEKAAVDPVKFLADETGTAAAAGIGAGAITQVPGLDQDNAAGNFADFGGQVGGVGVYGLGNMVRKGLGDLLAALSGNPKFASQATQAAAADTVIGNSDVLGSQVDPANPHQPVDTQAIVDLLGKPADAETTIPGFKASTADRAGDFGLANLENTRAKGPNAGRFRARQDANTTAVDAAVSTNIPAEQPGALRSALEGERANRLSAAETGTRTAQSEFDRYVQDLTPRMAAEERGATVREGLNNAERSQRDVESDVWRAITGESNAAPLAQRFDDTNAGLTEARRGTVADMGNTLDIPNRLSQAPEGEVAGPVDVQEISDLRSVLTTQQRNALRGPQPDRNRAEAIGRYIDAVDQHMAGDSSPETMRQIELARSVSRDVNERYNRPNDPIASVLSTQEGRPAVPDSAVGSRFIQPDNAQASNIDRLLAETDLSSHAVPVRTALREEILGGIEKVRAIGDPDRLQRYLDQFTRVFDRFPDLRQEITDAIGAGRRLNTAETAETALQRQHGAPQSGVKGNSPVAKYLEHSDATSEQAMGEVLSSKDPGAAADELLAFANDEPTAVNGARKAFSLVMERKARSKNGAFETSTGVEPWLPKKWRDFLDEPNVRAVMDRLWRSSPDQLANIRKIAEALRGVNSGAKAGATTNPSGSAASLRNGPITLAEAQAKFIDVQRGRLNPLYAITYLAGKIANRLVSKQAEKAYQMLLDEALLNPEVAAELLKKNNPANRAALAKKSKLWLGSAAAALTDALDGDDPERDDVVDAAMR